ncbi:MAG: ABC transporter permease [Acidobacteria bacterium]|nr:ABC transporter permease [Acidobacteriota bacterium]
MKYARTVAALLLSTLVLACVFRDQLTPVGYDHQDRNIPNAFRSRQHLLGTDALGRDRLARVLEGTRVSLVLAPSAAAISTVLAILIAGTAALAGGWVERLTASGIDLFLSLPWLFLLVTVRALLPLNVSPMTSAVITFSVLGCLGWAGAARLLSAQLSWLRSRDFILLARASGCGGFRLLRRHLLPNLMPLVYAQFWISIPTFILAEANLGILGLGVSEPLPSWGSLLRELDSFSVFGWNLWQLVPLALLIAVVSCFHLLISKGEIAA